MGGKKSVGLEWPLVAHDEANGELKYVWLHSGELLLVDPLGIHERAVRTAFPAETEGRRSLLHLVESAGRVFVMRSSRKVYMGERDSQSLRAASNDGDEDARRIEALLFSSPTAGGTSTPAKARPRPGRPSTGRPRRGARR